LSAKSTRNLLVAIGIAAAILDLLTKWWAFEAIPKDSHRVVLGDLIWFQPTHNPYGPWSLGQGLQLPAWVLPVLSVAAVGLIGRIFWETDPADRVKGLGLVLILGGAAGNLWDRVAALIDPAFGGVRDFILVRGVWFRPVRGLWRVWDWRWGEDFPYFNVADACITVGVVFVAWRILFEAQPAPAAPGGATAGSEVRA
jgi:signal peptidase II